jgi:hypothetical protein
MALSGERRVNHLKQHRIFDLDCVWIPYGKRMDRVWPSVPLTRLGESGGTECGMADITVKAAYGSVVEEEGQLFIGFAAGEDADEGYVLFRQDVGGGPVWFEASDETFGAEDAIEAVVADPKGFEVTIRPEKRSTYGFAASVAVRVGAGCEDGAEALEALKGMLGALWRG